MSNIKVYKDELKTKQTEVYEQHKDIIALIFILGNKVALQMQIANILLQYPNNNYKNENAVYKAINRLEEVDLIEKKEYKNLNLIVLRNPAIKWFAEEFNNKTAVRIFNTQSVGKKMNDERLYTSLFKLEYFSRYIKKEILIKDLYTLIDNNSLVYRKEKGLEMLTKFATKNIPDRQFQELFDHVHELKSKKTDKLATVPDRNGKTKQYTEDKRASFASGTANVKPIKKKTKSTTYNFNSVLNNKNLVLELDKYHNALEDNGYGKMIHQRKLYFNLYIFDINDSLNYIIIGDVIRKIYLMLQDMFGKKTAFVSENEECAKCPYNAVNKKLYQKLLLEKPHAKKCYPGTNAQRTNCKESFNILMREIYLNVTYVGWNNKRAEEVKLNCNKVSYDEIGLRDFPNLKYKVIDKKELDQYVYDEYITVNYKSFDLDRFTTRKGNKNLEEYNKKKQQNAMIKEELRENEETVKFLKDLKSVLEEENLELEDLKYLMRAVKKEKEKEQF